MYAYVSFLLIVLTYGMETALFNFSRLQEDKQKVYSTILTCVTLTSGIFIAGGTIFSQPIASAIHYPDYPEYIIWFALILGFDAVSSIAFAKLREQNKAKTFALIKTVNIAVNIFFNVFFLWICKSAFDKCDLGCEMSTLGSYYNPKIGIGYIFISNLIASGVTLLVLFPPLLKAKFSLDKLMLGNILPYALPLLIAGLAGMTNETMDRILLKYLLPANIALEQVGIYGACYKISIIMTMFLQTFRFAAEPFFFSITKELDAKKIYARVMDYFVIICMIIFLGTMMNISWIQYFVGKDFRSGIEVVPILLMANFCLGVFFNLSIWYKLTGQTKWGAYLTIFGAVITLIGNIVFIPIYGYMASAYATLVCYVGMMALSYFIGNKYYPVHYDLKRILGYLTLSLLLYAISERLEIKSDVLDLTVKNLLLVFFTGIVFLFERRNLFGKKNEK